MSKRIVWIEDDAYIIGSVVRPLEDRGYQFEIIESLQEALARVDELRECDLILLDILLPARSREWKRERHVGLVILEHLREQGVDTPVLVFTVVQNAGVMEALKELGVRGILNKPILPSELESAVMATLEEEE